MITLDTCLLLLTTTVTDVSEHADKGERADGNQTNHVRVRRHLPPLHGALYFCLVNCVDYVIVTCQYYTGSV